MKRYIKIFFALNMMINAMLYGNNFIEISRALNALNDSLLLLGQYIKSFSSITEKEPTERKIKKPEGLIDIEEYMPKQIGKHADIRYFSKVRIIFSNSDKNIYQLRGLGSLYVDQRLEQELKSLYPDINAREEKRKQLLFPSSVMEQLGSGYHAIRNAIILLNTLLSSDEHREKEMYRLVSAIEYLELYALWEKSVEKKRIEEEYEGDPRDRLFSDEIEYLISNIPKTETKNQVASQYITIPYFYITELFNYGRPILGIKGGGVPTKEFVKNVENFRNNKNFQHIFILKDMRSIARNETFWFVVAVNKVENNVQYLIIYPYEDSLLDQAESLFHDLNIENIDNLKMLADIGPFILSIAKERNLMKWFIKRENVGEAADAGNRLMNDLKQTMNYATTQKVLKSPYFKNLMNANIIDIMREMQKDSKDLLSKESFEALNNYLQMLQ